MAESLFDQNENSTEKQNHMAEDSNALRCGLKSWRPECLQRFVNPKWFMFCISIFSLMQGIIVNGLVSVSIPDIEKEFGFTSTQAGLILAFNDIAGILFVPLVSFFGTFGKKPKWIGYGALITGFGAVLFSTPKAMIGKRGIIGERLGRLYCNVTELNHPHCWQSSRSTTNGYLAILCLAQFIMGAGTTPLYTLGPTYLDENVNPQVSPIYLGIWFATTFLGPGFGFVVGGTFLRIFTDVNLPKDVTLTPQDPRWIGAWWMGFFLLSWPLMLSGLLLLCFPREMPAFRKKRVQALKQGDLLSADQDIIQGIRGFITATLRLVKNATYMFAVLGFTIRTFFGSAMGSFFTKIVLMKFGGTSFDIALSIGAVLLPAMTGSILAGSYIMKKMKLKDSAKSAALLCTCLSLLTCFGSCIFMIPGCNTTVLAGSTASYYNSTGRSLLSSCNSKCSCTRHMYAPVCGVDGKSYFSPCYAGCQRYISKTKFTSCLCIAKTHQILSMNSTKGETNTTSFVQSEFGNITGNISRANIVEATLGRCDRKCKNIAYFFLASFFLISTAFLSATPQNMILLRCVPENQRSYAVGLQFLFMRSISFIPGPLIFGRIIDSQCISWAKDDCGNRGNCLDYRVDSLSVNLVYLGVATSVIGTILYFFAWYFYKQTSAEKSKNTKNYPEQGTLIDGAEEHQDTSAV